jgi:ABC-type nitrate/sulfonate/bicarbonate transport system substrate-binding protein
MNVFRLLVAVLLILGFPPVSPAEDVIKLGGQGVPLSLLIAEAKGFLKAEGIRAEVQSENSSTEGLQRFADGEYDIIHTGSDNVIAWAEGQGADRKNHDFIFFMGGRKGIGNTLVVPPQVKSFADLKGKLLAVDAYNSGFAPVLVYILHKNGLTLKKDYEMKAVGGDGLRRDSILKGETFAGLISLDEEMKKRGYYVIARAQDYFTAYAVGEGAARREWAQQHEDLLVRYIRGVLRGTGWILDPNNKQDVLQVLTSSLHRSPEQAEQLYRGALDHKIGLIPRAKINPNGIKTLLELRKLMGQMNDPLPAPSKYIDERYYKKALATLGGSGGKKQ